ncbi:MAG: YqiA/YcfP family alpha/beta fold hydrolase [Bacteroidaceae bacterium]|nr:YqiA/YcfP family alpha/beta fold hydrolase [Bacteroidaceae bacterium]
MKIVYFHGFGSSHASGTVEILRRELPDDTVAAPDIPVDPAEALPYLRQFCADEQPDLIIGTSMGGMYAQQMRSFRRILVNPAFNMSTMSKGLKTGEHKFYSGRYDGAKTFKITKDIITHHNQMERQQFKGITAAERETCWCLVGLHDTTVTNAEAVFKKNYLADHLIRFDGEHQLNDKVIKKVLLPLIEQMRHC